MAKVAAATLLFAATHSLLASRAAKRAATRVAGERTRNGWYRPLFIVQATVSTGMLAAYVKPLSGPVLWRARGPLAWLLAAGQVGGVLLLVAGARAVGIPSFLGAPSLAAWWRGDRAVPREPEAQGPAAAPDGGLRVVGPFRITRHPLNLSPLPILWLCPVMTVNLATFNVVATLYMIAGSVHEETRLARAHGAAYEGYRLSGAPFFVPLPGRLGLQGRGPRGPGSAKDKT